MDANTFFKDSSTNVYTGVDVGAVWVFSLSEINSLEEAVLKVLIKLNWNYNKLYIDYIIELI